MDALIRPAIAAALAAVCGCGLLSPGEPPATPSAPVPGWTPPDAPIPAPPPPAGVAPSPPLPGYALVWRDEFDGTAVDPARWVVEARRRRDALNDPASATVQDGLLRITTFTDEAGVHHTGYLETVGLFELTYGYVEARIRFHEVPGTWCAFWLYPETYGQPIGDPGAAGVEIDVVEHRVVDGGGWNVRDLVMSGINWDGFGADWKKAHRTQPPPDGGPVWGAWRTFSVLWTPAGYTFYVDQQPLWSTSAAVSHRSQPIYLTCEVKDRSWAGTIPSGGYGPAAASEDFMEVDWVRAWQPAP
ncbi:glycoside hydrolase family 16 protein [Anaeromyxobacter sp. PSR-1]|uniref:glycoside hydrolase family 16 protein n=1 Tax=unclassified Anaeromyxobacter TaxID=2620896 RepID=UPI0005E2E274|nr:glycoside hydrolase family 16 protein [Anaeromyxobacter sp. PSR-1]GAO05085.1 glucan endo-1,3-beta-glucosidase A1 [Anaeromyxobacter sp. PSR-1]